MTSTWPETRVRKFRQAAFVYLHLGILYEGAAWVMWRHDLLPSRFGPPWVFLLAGAAIIAFVVWGLAVWRNVWVARIVWGVQAFRFPPLISHAFLPDVVGARLPPAFYVAAMIVVLISMWALARAGWDL